MQVPFAARLQRVQEMEAMLGLEDARGVLVGGDAFHQVSCEDMRVCGRVLEEVGIDARMCIRVFL